MRKRMKVFVVALAAVCALGTFTACDDFSDFVPNEYGAWDGNYVYLGNVKGKTTGEDPETLVSSVVIEEKTYTVEHCADYAFVGETLYLALVISDEALREKTCLVRYDLEMETSTLVYIQQETYTGAITGEEVLVYDVEEIVKVLSDGIILQSNKQGWYKIDMTGSIRDGDCNELREFERAGATYLYKWENSVLFYRTWENETLNVAYDGTGSEAVSHQSTYVEKENCKGFLLETYDTNNFWNGLYFFDLLTGSLTALDTSACGENMLWIYNAADYEYFVAYDFEWVTYTVREGLFSMREATTTQPKNCVLWHIVYNENEISLEKAYAFDEDKDFLDIQAIYGDTLYVEAEWYALASGCDGGGHKRAYYHIDMQRGVEKRITDKTLEKGANEGEEALARETGVSCGGYTYYIRTQMYIPPFGAPNYAYSFSRFDGRNTEIMQIWASGSQEDENYCEEMWRQVESEYGYYTPIEYEFVVKEK